MIPLDAAKQREALSFIADNLFSDEPFTMPGGYMQKLGPNRWLHWGSNSWGRQDFPFYSRVLAMQRLDVGLRKLSPTYELQMAENRRLG